VGWWLEGYTVTTDAKKGFWDLPGCYNCKLMQFDGKRFRELSTYVFFGSTVGVSKTQVKATTMLISNRLLVRDNCKWKRTLDITPRSWPLILLRLSCIEYRAHPGFDQDPGIVTDFVLP